jgi:hypothetical protein
MAWTLIKIGGIGENFGEAHKEYMIDDVSDIATLPTTDAPGSSASTADLQLLYRLDQHGVWKKVGEA